MTDVAAEAPVAGWGRLARNTAVYAAADVAAKGGAYALVPILTRGLSGVEFGAWALVTAFITVLMLVCSLGLGGAVTRLWFDADASQRRRFHLAAFATLQAAAFAIAAALTLSAGPVFGAIFPRVPPRLFAIGVWTSALLASTTVPLAVLRAEERARAFAALSGAQFLLPAAGMIAAVAAGAGVEGVLWGNLLGAAFVLCTSLVLLRGIAAPPADWGAVRPALALGVPLVPHLVAHWALNAIDRVAIHRLLGAAAVGLYVVGYQIAQGVSLIATAVNNATVPSFYRAAQRGRMRLLGRAWAPMQLGFGVLALGVSLFAEEIVAVLVPARYASTARFVPWVALGYWLLAGYYFPVNALFHAKRVRLIPVFTIGAAALKYGLNVVLIPEWGLIAAAYSTAIAYGALLVAAIIAAQRVNPIPYGFVRAALIGVLGTGCYVASTTFPGGASGTALKVPLLLAFGAAGLVIVRDEIDDVRALRAQPPDPGAGSRRVVLAASTATQARTMLAAADALRAEGLTPRFVSLDRIAGKTASAVFTGAGVPFDEPGEPSRSQRARRIRIVVRGRAWARAIVRGAGAVVIGNDFTPFERLLIDEARGEGAVSVLVQDGVIALSGEAVGGGARSGEAVVGIAKRVLHWLGFPFQARPYGMGGCDLVCVYGPSTARALTARGVPEGCIVVTGQPRYDRLTPREASEIILVTTQPFSRYGMASRAQEEALFAAMIGAATAAGRGRSVVVKLHPDTDPESRSALEAFAEGRASFEQVRPIEPLLARSAAVVTLSSTTALEAMAMSVPVVVVEAPGFPATLPYLESAAVIPARSAEGIATALQRALAQGVERHAVERFLSQHLAPLDGRAAERVAAAIRRLLDDRMAARS